MKVKMYENYKCKSMNFAEIKAHLFFREEIHQVKPNLVISQVILRLFIVSVLVSRQIYGFIQLF